MTIDITIAPGVTWVTDPASPCAGQPFSVKWTEINNGDEASQPYQDAFQMNCMAETQTQTLDVGDPLQPGATAERTLSFTLGHADTYNMNIEINGRSAYLGDVIVADCSSSS
jgi:hypothetical protein